MANSCQSFLQGSVKHGFIGFRKKHQKMAGSVALPAEREAVSGVQDVP
jgi:hypothetical protein